MIDRPMWRPLVAAAAVALSMTLAPSAGFGFPQSTETSGEITPNLTGTWLVVNRLEFSKNTSTSDRPGATPTPGLDPKDIRPFTVGYLFTIEHVPTSVAQKRRDAEKAKKQEAVDKATKILAEEQLKAAKDPKPAPSGALPVEPKVLSYGIPKAPDSAVDQHDEVSVKLLDVDLPKAVQAEIDAKNKAEEVWEPSQKDLALLKSSWKTLKPRQNSEYSRIQWKVMEQKYLEGGMLQDEKTKNAKFVISGDATLIGTPGQPNRNILVYGADKVSDTVLEGGHVRAIMTSAPFPIPIDMKGRFKMYRLTDVPKAQPKDK
ncbi:MAG: hypothetical protein IT293_04125 [Deltaproteobacteria bacterium]|nr:hypothetical protein [Deltaproteobacteria bacterium]